MHSLHRRIDGIVCQTDFQVETVMRWHGIGREKMHIIGLGTDTTRFEVDIDRQPNRFIYASAPERGLDTLIDLFPLIRRRIPDAELHVFYGWDLADLHLRFAVREAARLARPHQSVQSVQSHQSVPATQPGRQSEHSARTQLELP